MSKKLNRSYYHEVADRISVIQDNIEDHLREHPAIRRSKKLKRAIDKVQFRLGKIYQKMASKV